MITLIIAIALAYTIGSISSAILICRIYGLGDPRQHGSHNPGATNVMRLAGKSVAAQVLVGDALKGTIAVGIAYLLGIRDFPLGLVALAAIVGHIFPCFFQFKGGKGVATTIGAVLALNLYLGLLYLLIWAGVYAWRRISSLAALSATALLPILSLAIHISYFAPLLLISALLFWAHRENIMRLRQGQEGQVK